MSFRGTRLTLITFGAIALQADVTSGSFYSHENSNGDFNHVVLDIVYFNFLMKAECRNII